MYKYTHNKQQRKYRTKNIPLDSHRPNFYNYFCRVNSIFKEFYDKQYFFNSVIIKIEYLFLKNGYHNKLNYDLG